MELRMANAGSAQRKRELDYTEGEYRFCKVIFSFVDSNIAVHISLPYLESCALNETYGVLGQGNII